MKTVLGKENNNELKSIQRILLNQMGRLDNNELMKEQGKREILRSGALSQSASSYIKSVATQIKVLELTNTYNVEPSDMNKYLGIESENK